MQSLDAKFMDENINNILESMFPNNSYKKKYQKIGWINKDKSKGKKLINLHILLGICSI